MAGNLIIMHEIKDTFVNAIYYGSVKIALLHHWSGDDWQSFICFLLVDTVEQIQH